MTAVGVANPMAQGQAITRTATMWISARVKGVTSELIARGGPNTNQPIKVSEGNNDHNWDKYGSNLIDQFLDGCFTTLSFFNQADDLRRGGVFTHPGRFEAGMIPPYSLLRRSPDCRWIFPQERIPR